LKKRPAPLLTANINAISKYWCCTIKKIINLFKSRLVYKTIFAKLTYFGKYPEEKYKKQKTAVVNNT